MLVMQVILSHILWEYHIENKRQQRAEHEPFAIRYQNRHPLQKHDRKTYQDDQVELEKPTLEMLCMEVKTPTIESKVRVRGAVPAHSITTACNMILIISCMRTARV